MRVIISLRPFYILEAKSLNLNLFFERVDTRGMDGLDFSPIVFTAITSYIVIIWAS